MDINYSQNVPISDLDICDDAGSVVGLREMGFSNADHLLVERGNYYPVVMKGMICKISPINYIYTLYVHRNLSSLLKIFFFSR